jgi:hypothetical protein
LLLVVVVLLGAGLAGLWWLGGGEEPAPDQEIGAPAPREEPTAPLGRLGQESPDFEPGAAPVPELREEPPAAAPPPAEPLPPLARSDGLARELATPVSKHALFGVLLRDAGLIERFVLLVDNLAEGLVPRRPLAALVPKQKLVVLGQEPELRLDPASYRRFDAVTAAIASLDAPSAVAAYRHLAPLCEESYRALGYPEGGFEARLRGALTLLLSTPTAGPSPALVPETLRYEFADPALENLTDAQKLLLRIGPENGERVRRKLREIETALGDPR